MEPTLELKDEGEAEALPTVHASQSSLVDTRLDHTLEHDLYLHNPRKSRSFSQKFHSPRWQVSREVLPCTWTPVSYVL